MREQKPFIAAKPISKLLVLLSLLMSTIYFSWWFRPENIGNPWLYLALFLGEVYHFIMTLLFLMTVWPKKKAHETVLPPGNEGPSVAIFITVAGEPVEVVRKTAIAAKQQIYANSKIFILNDGYVAGKENWKDMETLADSLSIQCITRKKGGGAKAGNINYALQQTTSDIVVILDADMAPYSDFISSVVPYFSDPSVGFVQTPQYYENASLNDVTGGSWEQQALFFGPILVGKDTWNSAFICGTNVAIRRTALNEVGGMTEDNIAEDFLTSLLIHEKGWKSRYLHEVYARGLAPEDLQSYYKQQLRWARGNLEAMLTAFPLVKRGLSWGQRLQYLSSSLYYCNGIVVFIDAVMPLLFLFFNLQPVASATTSFALYFIPFMFLNLYLLYIVSGNGITFRAIAFSQSSWLLQLQALFSVLLRRKMGFAVTAKKGLSGSFRHLAYPHLLYILFAVVGASVAILREGVNPSVVTNISWVIFNSVMFIPFIQAAFRPQEVTKQEKVSVAQHVSLQL